MVQRAAPILLLVGLKYRGNVGSIIRAAVQADLFEAVYIIEERPEEKKPTRAEGETEGGKSLHCVVL